MTKSKDSTNTQKETSVKTDKKKNSLLEKFKNCKSKGCSFSKPFIASIFLLAGIGGTLLTQSFAHKIDNDSYKKGSTQDQQIKMLQAWQKEVNEWMKNSHAKQMDKSDKFFDDFYSDSYDPFSDMNNIHKRMRERFSNFDKLFNNNFDDFTKPNYSSSSSRTSISQKEDDEFVYYQLNFKGFDKDDISVKIEDKILSFAAKKLEDRTSEDKNSKSRSKMGSNFLYSFSVPKNVDLNNPEIVKENGKIVVKFKKN
jgi:HSP20 family molecular chaperone IbpA